MNPYADRQMSPGRRNSGMMGMSQSRMGYSSTSVRGFINPNPLLGGHTYRVNNLTPTLDFSAAQKNTPEPDSMVKVIPWDSQHKDFVYAIVSPEDFDGRMNPIELKRVTLLLEFLSLR